MTSSKSTASLRSDKGPSEASRAVDSFLPFILPCAPAEGQPGEISLRQKKTMDILPGYTGSPGCGSLEADRAGTREQISTSLSDSSGPCQRKGNDPAGPEQRYSLANWRTLQGCIPEIQLGQTGYRWRAEANFLPGAMSFKVNSF